MWFLYSVKSISIFYSFARHVFMFQYISCVVFLANVVFYSFSYCVHLRSFSLGSSSGYPSGSISSVSFGLVLPGQEASLIRNPILLSTKVLILDTHTVHHCNMFFTYIKYAMTAET